MRLKKSLLVFIEIDSSLEYNSKRKTGTYSVLPLYISLSPILPLLLSSLPSYNSTSQLNQDYYESII